MDTASEYEGAAPSPETHQQRIEHIRDLINDSNDVDATPATDTADGQKVDAEDVRGADSEAGELDVSPATQDANEGVEDDTQESEDSAAEGASDAVSLSSLAEHLGIEPADVYELEIPIGDGITANLGQLKDEFKEYGPAKTYQKKLTQERENFERAQLQTRSELNAIVNAIPEGLREQVITAGRAHQQQWSKDQETAVLEAIPDWADADKRAKDRASLVEDGAEYGFSEQEITFTQDARTLRMLRDFSRMKRELAGMSAAAKAQPGKASPPGKAATTQQSKRKLAAALKRAKSDPTTQGKASVVSQLIRNQ